MPKFPLIFLGFCCAFPATGYASDKGVEASKCLQTRMQISQEIGNIFSRTIAFQVNGYDDFVRRVGGTGLYKVLSVASEQIVLRGTFLYDGNPASTGENTIKDGGRTICWKEIAPQPRMQVEFRSTRSSGDPRKENCMLARVGRSASPCHGSLVHQASKP